MSALAASRCLLQQALLGRITSQQPVWLSAVLAQSQLHQSSQWSTWHVPQKVQHCCIQCVASEPSLGFVFEDSSTSGIQNALISGLENHVSAVGPQVEQSAVQHSSFSRPSHCAYATDADKLPDTIALLRNLDNGAEVNKGPIA